MVTPEEPNDPDASGEGRSRYDNLADVVAELAASTIKLNEIAAALLPAVAAMGREADYGEVPDIARR